MFYALQHHRMVVDHLMTLAARPYDPIKDLEPLSDRAVSGAFKLLSCRPDLAIGASLNETTSNGLKFEILRGSIEVFIEIDPKGRVFLNAFENTSSSELKAASFGSVNQKFLSALNACAPDPVLYLAQEAGAPRSEKFPIPGLQVGQPLGDFGFQRVHSDQGAFLSVPISRAMHGFDTICVSSPSAEDLCPNDIPDVFRRAFAESDVHLGRRFSSGPAMALHDLRSAPESVLRKGVLPCGRLVSELHKDIQNRLN